VLRRSRPGLGLALALGVFLFAFLLRLAFGDTMKVVPFITVFPAILIAAMLGGLRAGILVALLSGLTAWYWFVDPVGSFWLPWPDGYLIMIFFVITAAIQLYVIRTLNLAVDQLWEERDRTAVLFKELQHRVANNLQFVSSLLSWQRRTAISDPASSAKALDMAQNRLELMGRIHRRLYDPDAISMPLGRYFEGLCQEILEASGAKNVVCLVEVPTVTFDINRLMALSLLLNEAITNSVKHGFGGRDRGTVFIRLDQDAANRYALTIKDDGNGLADVTALEGLGSNIMRSAAAGTALSISLRQRGAPGRRLTKKPLLRRAIVKGKERLACRRGILGGHGLSRR
jgi:two-component sensor histidine kinase